MIILAPLAMLQSEARKAGGRVTALALLGMLLTPHVLGLAGARVAGPSDGCCIDRSCCCPPKATPASCHGRAPRSAPVVRCHHAASAATVPAMPALVSPRMTALPSRREGVSPSPAAAVPRLGFGRIESPPPRLLGNA